MSNELSEVDKKIYEYLLSKGGEGVLQNTLSSELGFSSREVSKSLKKLESLKLIKREPVVFNGRKTYRVIVVKKRLNELVEEKSKVVKPVVSLNGFLDIPCMSCPYIMTICYEGGYYDPRNCPWLREWIENNIRRK